VKNREGLFGQVYADGKRRQKLLLTGEQVAELKTAKKDPRKAAEKLLTLWAAEVINAPAAAVAADAPDALTLATLADKYLKNLETNVGDRHAKIVRAQLTRFATHVGPSVLAADVTRSTVEDYLAALKKEDGAAYTVEKTDADGKVTTETKHKPFSPATQRRHLAAISGAFRFALDREDVTMNPAHGVKLAKGQEYEPTFLTTEQIRKLYAHLPEQIKALVTFLGESGCRLGEGSALQWHEVRDDFSGVTLTKTKSGKNRFVPLTETAQTVLQKLHDARIAPMTGADPVFRQLSKSRIERLFRDAVKTAGLPPARIHDLRHSYASALVQIGKPLSVVAQLLGHSSMIVTNRYAKHAPANLATEAVAALGKARCSVVAATKKTKKTGTTKAS
jgi:integrase